MASKSPEDKLDFLLQTLATCDEFKPNYDKLQDAMKINTKYNAQRQLKAVIESTKQYALESIKGSTRVVDKSAKTTTKSRKRSKKESEDGDDEEGPAKKNKQPKAKMQVVESENEDDEE